MKNLIQATVTASIASPKQYNIRTSEMCLSLALGGEAKAIGESVEYTFRIASLKWAGKSYKGQIAAYTAEGKVAAQSFESPSGTYLQETMNRNLRKLATKLDVDLIPVNQLTY